MSSVFYIASDFPLAERKNPHEKMVSINEALAQGIKISDCLLEREIDRDKPGVIMVSDRDVIIDVNTGVITDGNFADDFSVLVAEKTDGMRTTKNYCAFLEMVRYTPERAAQFIEYLKEHLKNTSEIELWHAWISNELNDSINKIEKNVSIDDLKSEAIAELMSRETWTDLHELTDYCYIISR